MLRRETWKVDTKKFSAERMMSIKLDFVKYEVKASFEGNNYQIEQNISIADTGFSAEVPSTD